MIRAKKQAGFTLVELLVTVPIFIISIAVLIGFLITLYTALLQKDAESEMALEGQQVLSTVQDDLFFARNFAESTSSIMVDADGPGGHASGWTYNTSPNDTLIVYEMALDKVREDPTRAVVYQKTAASGNSCDPASIELNPPVLNNLIYYVSGTNLRRRVLVPDPTQSRCATPFRKQTCSTDKTRIQQTAGGPVSVACAADSTLASDIKNFSVDYYDADNNLIDLANGGSPLQAERITVKLTLSKIINAIEVDHTSQLTITKINGGDPNIE